MYESAADALGRGIRYGEWPDDPESRSRVEFVQGLSINEIASAEQLRDEVDQIEAQIADLEGLGHNWLVKGSRSRRPRNRALLRRVDSLRQQLGEHERLLQSGLQELKQFFDAMKGR